MKKLLLSGLICLLLSSCFDTPPECPCTIRSISTSVKKGEYRISLKNNKNEAIGSYFYTSGIYHVNDTLIH
jgi:hypothetical protein